MTAIFQERIHIPSTRYQSAVSPPSSYLFKSIAVGFGDNLYLFAGFYFRHLNTLKKCGPFDPHQLAAFAALTPFFPALFLGHGFHSIIINKN